jgi:WD40 repeat protein
MLRNIFFQSFKRLVLLVLTILCPFLPFYGLYAQSTDILRATGKVTTDLRLEIPLGHTNEVDGALFNTNGTRILTFSMFDGTAKLWDVSTGKLIHTLKQDRKSVV